MVATTDDFQDDKQFVIQRAPKLDESVFIEMEMIRKNGKATYDASYEIKYNRTLKALDYLYEVANITL